MENWQEKINYRLKEKTVEVKRKACGELHHDYLVPSGPYSQQWDWDSFFMGMALSGWIPSEAVYLKNVTLNITEHSSDDGFTPGCLKTDGPSSVLKHTKPFVAQGAFLAAKKLDDFNWIEAIFDKLKKIVLYREKNCWHEKYGLASWWDAMESGADNNVSIEGYANNTVISPDLNTYIFLEYKAMAAISRKLNYNGEAEEFEKKSKRVKDFIDKYLWNEEDNIFHTLNSGDGKHIRRITFSGMVPLWAKIPDKEKAEKMIRNNVLNEKKLLSKHGIRTLSADDRDYNQRNIIKPCSNWQGPVWPIANYIHAHGMALYGFEDAAMDIAKRVSELCLQDIDRTGGMHECYNADTGEPLAAPDFVSWNLLLMNLVVELENREHPLRELIF